jgi:hypothetical protein
VWRYISYLVVGSALLGCVGRGTLDDGHANGGSGGGGSGGTGPLPAPGVCSAPDGKLVPHGTVADLTSLIVGDWLHCGGDSFFAEFGIGLRISSDHSWNVLVRDATGVLQPITTGFDGYGTWSALEVTPGQTQFNLHRITGGGAGGFPTVTDGGKMRLDWGGVWADYVRLSAGDATGPGGAGGVGGTGGPVSVPGPGDCAAPGGYIVPYSTLADFERLIHGDWQRCNGNAASTSGLRISPDHTWNTLAADSAGALQVIATGGSSGTWTALEGSKSPFQFNLHYVHGGGMGHFVSFTDSGQMRMESGIPADYVRLGVGAAP